MASEQPGMRAKWASAKVQGDALWAQLSARLAANEAAERERGICAEEVRLFADASAATAGWGRLGRALLDVSQWPLWWSASGRFAVYDAGGLPQDRTRLEPGDHIRDDTYRSQRGPSWLWVETIAEGPERTDLVLRPSADPTARAPTLQVTAHFYTAETVFEASLVRRGASIKATLAVKGAAPNVHEQAGGTLMAARNDRVVQQLDPALWQAMLGRLIGL